MIRHLVIAVVVSVASMAGSLGLAPSIGAQAIVPIDLPATLLVPADLGTVGLDDYGTGVGATGGAETMSAFDHAYRGAGVDDGRFPSSVEPERGASLYLIDGAGMDDPTRVLSSVVLYVDSGAATDAIDRVIRSRSDVAVTVDDDPVAGTETDVDSVAAFVIEGEPPYDDAALRQTSIVARVGSAIIEVSIERLDGTAAPVADVAALLPAMLDRLARAIDADSSVGGAAFDVTGGQIVPSLSRYVYRDGKVIPQFGQSDGAAASQSETFKTYQANDVFQLGFASSDGGLAIGGFLSRHDSQDAARSYFRAIPDLLATNDVYADVRVDNEIVRVGDSATLVTYGIDGDDGVVVTELVVLLGDTVVELIVNAPADISSADMTALARTAESCLTDGDCQPLVVPDDAAFGIT